MSDVLEKPSKLERAPVARGVSATAVDREGGDNGAGLIRSLAVITRTEALGHYFWIDSEMLSQVAAAINATGNQGIKGRFTHPGLSGDGLGSFLGRLKNARVDGDVVRADLHFSESAHNTPDGDLAAYTMQLAEDDPEAFGTSIVFLHDWEAEEQFEAKHTEVVEWEEPDSGRKRSRSVFRSPDPLNEDDLPHARLKQLRAVDVVDEPAANPNGLFHRQADIGEDADALASYVLGISKERPQLAALSIDPDRVSGHLNRFLDRNGLEIVPRKEVVTVSETAEQVTPTRDELCAELDRYTAKFGAAKGLELFKNQTPWAEALESHCNELTTELSAAREELATAQKQVEELQARAEELEANLKPDSPTPTTPKVEFKTSDRDSPDASLGAEDDDDAQAKKAWDSNADLREDFAGDFACFKSAFARHPDEYADLLN